MAQQPSLVSRRYPYLDISFTIGGVAHTGEALVDTGFDGAFIFPISLTSALPVEDEWTPWGLVDGSVVLAPSYRAAVRIGAFPSFSAVGHAVGAEFLLGRTIVDQFAVTFDHGQRVIVQL